MVLLSPPKLLMILVIALVVLGPDKLPSAARRIGAAWRDFTRWRAQLENEVRASFPDLPSTTEVARAVRSPISLLDRLAEEHGASTGVDAGGGPPGDAGPARFPPARSPARSPSDDSPSDSSPSEIRGSSRSRADHPVTPHQPASSLDVSSLN
jgi:TatA/E family protein of Tat protein translocase